MQTDRSRLAAAPNSWKGQRQQEPKANERHRCCLQIAASFLQQKMSPPELPSREYAAGGCVEQEAGATSTRSLQLQVSSVLQLAQTPSPLLPLVATQKLLMLLNQD